MRVHLYTHSIGGRRNVSKLRYASHKTDIRLGDIQGTFGQEIACIKSIVPHLSPSYREWLSSFHFQVAIYIISQHRLFEPMNIQFSQSNPDIDRS